MNVWPTTWQERAAMFACYLLAAILFWVVMFPHQLCSLVFRALELVGV